MKALVIVISKWAHTLRNFARLIFCDDSKSGPTRAKNDVNIGISMENGQKMIKKADKISELTPIFLKFHTKQVYRNTIKMFFPHF